MIIILNKINDSQSLTIIYFIAMCTKNIQLKIGIQIPILSLQIKTLINCIHSNLFLHFNLFVIDILYIIIILILFYYNNI